MSLRLLETQKKTGIEVGLWFVQEQSGKASCRRWHPATPPHTHTQTHKGKKLAKEKETGMMGTDVPHSFPHSSMPTPDDPYEVKRARELNQLLGPKGTGQAFDVVLDLHNTTANTGVCLIAAASESSFNLHLCHYLQVVPRGQEGGQGGGRGINVTSVPLGLPPEVLQTKQGKEVGQGG